MSQENVEMHKRAADTASSRRLHESRASAYRRRHVRVRDTSQLEDVADCLASRVAEPEVLQPVFAH
jgi:hypothetical protein